MFGILFDGTRCTGCERCVEACVEENDLDPVWTPSPRQETGRPPATDSRPTGCSR